MNMIENIKRDREEGTPGPWSAFTDDTGPHTNIVSPTPRTSCVFSIYLRDKREPDIQRVCRVPEMEAALLAAEELAKFVDLVDGSFGGGRVVTFSEADIAECKQALAAFRKATGAA